MARDRSAAAGLNVAARLVIPPAKSAVRAFVGCHLTTTPSADSIAHILYPTYLTENLPLAMSVLTSKRVRIFTEEDVQQHTKPESCWVSYNGKVYDVTGFLADHPGGDDLVLEYAGKDVGDIMKDTVSHDHSDSAYDMLEEFCVGRLGTGEQIVDEGE
jgi:cytochrome b involved in lipid metabolism